MNDSLDVQDIDLLMQALEALSEHGKMESAFGDLVGAILTQDEQKRQEWIEGIDQRDYERKHQERFLQEQIVIVKAKLIQIRRHLDVTDLLPVLKREQARKES